MKMADVRVGMRLRPTLNPGYTNPDITVTDITEHGFVYSVDDARVLHARFGLVMAREGHEHYGVNGEAWYEPIAWYDPAFVDPCDVS